MPVCYAQPACVLGQACRDPEWCWSLQGLAERVRERVDREVVGMILREFPGTVDTRTVGHYRGVTTNREDAAMYLTDETMDEMDQQATEPEEDMAEAYAASRAYLVSQAADLAHGVRAAGALPADLEPVIVDAALVAWAWTWVDPFTPSHTDANVVQRVLGDPRA